LTEVNLVFGRKELARTQGQQFKDELGESYEHLRLAASHAAGGAAEKLTPPYDRARYAANRGWITTKDAFAPLYEQIRSGAANARKDYEPATMEKKNRWGALFGLLAAGAAVGAIGAVIVRRRKAAAQWDDYDPITAVDEMTTGEKSSTTQKVTAGAASVADTVSAQAGKLADSLHEKSGAGSRTSGTSAMHESASTMTDKTADLPDKTATGAEKAAKKAADKTSDLTDRP
jgi:hypothetical protein